MSERVIGRVLRRVGSRLLLAVVVATAVVVTLRLLGYEPATVRIALVVVLLLSVVGLLVDVTAAPPPQWYGVPLRPPVSQGRDAATQRDLRRLEDHRRSRRPDDQVRARLVGLAEDVLRVRHGVGLDSEQGRALLGPEVLGVLLRPAGGSRAALSPTRIDRCLRRLEELS